MIKKPLFGKLLLVKSNQNLGYWKNAITGICDSFYIIPICKFSVFLISNITQEMQKISISFTRIWQLLFKSAMTITMTS